MMQLADGCRLSGARRPSPRVQRGQLMAGAAGEPARRPHSRPLPEVAEEVASCTKLAGAIWTPSCNRQRMTADGAPALAARACAEEASGRVGLRRTLQRVELLTAITTMTHATVEALEGLMAPRGMAVSTVYRTLWSLELAGLVEGATFGAGPTIYHLAGGVPHTHEVCRSCGGVQDSDPIQLALLEGIRGSSSFTAGSVLVVVLGTCAACQPCAAQAGRGSPAVGTAAGRRTAGAISTARQQCSAPGV